MLENPAQYRVLMGGPHEERAFTAEVPHQGLGELEVGKRILDVDPLGVPGRCAGRVEGVAAPLVGNGLERVHPSMVGDCQRSGLEVNEVKRIAEGTEDVG